jgi:hypothetical protein
MTIDSAGAGAYESDPRTAAVEVTFTRPTAWARIVERERALDEYRRNVEGQLDEWFVCLEGDLVESLSHYVPQCFDWGVSAPACARTWLAGMHGAIVGP